MAMINMNTGSNPVMAKQHPSVIPKTVKSTVQKRWVMLPIASYSFNKGNIRIHNPTDAKAGLCFGSIPEFPIQRGKVFNHSYGYLSTTLDTTGQAHLFVEHTTIIPSLPYPIHAELEGSLINMQK